MVVRYVDSNGKQRIKGGTNLKSSQSYPKRFLDWFGNDSFYFWRRCETKTTKDQFSHIFKLCCFGLISHAIRSALKVRGCPGKTSQQVPQSQLQRRKVIPQGSHEEPDE